MQRFIRTSAKLLLLCLTAGLPTACEGKSDTALLRGKLDVNEPTAVNLVYDYKGENVVEELVTDSTGTFSFDGALRGEEADLVIYIGQDIYGAYVKNGASSQMRIADGKVTFSGDNVDRCVFNNTLFHAFSPWDFKPTPDHPFKQEEWSERLERGKAEVQKAVEAVADKDARSRYQALADATYTYYRLQNLTLESMVDNVDNKSQTDSIIATIDPNADVARLSGLITYWYNKSDIHSNTKGTVSLTDFYISQITQIDSVLTNEANKASLMATLTSMFLLYEPSEGDIKALREGIAAQLKKAPFIDKSIEEALQARAHVVKDGDALPTNPTLLTRDGSKTTLGEVIAGKVAYIDFWATWCAPCCREIPYFEKVWQQYRDDDRIVFVSISQDQKVQAWERKMDADKPQWPNYIFDQISGREFLSAMSINAIPRFMIIDKNGKIIAVDAPRPSNENIKQVLDAALNL